MKFERFKDTLQDLKKISQGWRGVIYCALWRGRRVAVKVARSEEKIKALRKEMSILLRLKGEEGFPEIIFRGEDFFVYPFIEGTPFGKLQLTPEKRKEVLRKVLILARKLDRMGIDHGELTRIEKNVLVTEKGDVYLLDFERGTEKGKGRNVNQFIQVLRREGILSPEEAVHLGKEYRRNGEGAFKKLMDKII